MLNRTYILLSIYSSNIYTHGYEGMHVTLETSIECVCACARVYDTVFYYDGESIEIVKKIVI